MVNMSYYNLRFLVVWVFKRYVSLLGVLQRSTSSLLVPNRSTYKLVTNDPPPKTVDEIVDRAAQSIFWTELFRGIQIEVQHFIRAFFQIIIF